MDAPQSPLGIRLLARKLDEHERNTVAQRVGLVLPADVHGDHGLQRHWLATTLDQKLAHGAGTRRQIHVVELGAKAGLDLLEVVERPLDPGQAPLRR